MLWIKTFHILFVMSWLVGIFYLPRIFVHYAEGKEANEDVRRLLIMAERLLKFMTLMAILSVLFGGILWLWFGIAGNWLYVKIIFVILLVSYHVVCWHYVTKMLNGTLLKKGRFYRNFNELSLAIVIPILILVVVKPI